MAINTPSQEGDGGMDQRLWWRLRLYRWGQAHDRWLRVFMVAGFVGLAVTLALRSLAPQLWPGWQLLAMGGSLVLAGAGHALLGEQTTVGAYIRGESDELPAVTRMASGLLASLGGALIALSGLAQMVG